MKSPLRYPGGKSKAVDIITRHIPLDVNRLCSPFLGGGSIELFCASKGIEVFGYDVFDPLVIFWNELLTNSELLYTEIKKYHPLSTETFKEFQKNIMSETNTLKKAAMFYVINRSSFSGITLSGGMSKNHPRFTEKSIENILNFKIKNFNVEKMDFKDSIPKHKNDFLYLDPPYLLETNNLYGVKGNTHKDFDHQRLFELLKDRDQWIMSYNKSDIIIEMYKDFKYYIPEWSYGMSNDKTSKEIIIFSKDLT